MAIEQANYIIAGVDTSLTDERAGFIFTYGNVTQEMAYYLIDSNAVVGTLVTPTLVTYNKTAAAVEVDKDSTGAVDYGIANTILRFTPVAAGLYSISVTASVESPVPSIHTLKLSVESAGETLLEDDSSVDATASYDAETLSVFGTVNVVVGDVVDVKLLLDGNTVTISDLNVAIIKQ